MNIIQIIINYTGKSCASLCKMIKCNDFYKTQVLNETSFLKENATIAERVYVIKNLIKEIPCCKFCGKKLTFGTISYSLFCSKKCSAIYRQHHLTEDEKKNKSISISNKYWDKSIEERKKIKEKRKKTFIEKYNVDHNFKIPEVIENRKNTWIKNYGHDIPTKNEDIKNKIITTNIKKYGGRSALCDITIKKKAVDTLMKNYNVDVNLKSKVIKEKIKNTIFKKYGVEHFMQNAEFYDKFIKKAYQYKDYILPSEKIIKIQGNESIALDYLFNLDYKEHEILYSNVDITTNCGMFFYFYKDKLHRYYPDFFDLKKNRIIEVKSLYTYRCSAEVNELKRKAVIEKNINFVYFIIENKKIIEI